MKKENTAKKHAVHGFKQVQLTNYLCNNLSQFNLKPTTKLVLLYLSSCFNPKHADVFPKQKTIADRMGISERSVISAIRELHKEGLIISERKCSNRYTFTSKVLSQVPENNNLTRDEKGVNGGISFNVNKFPLDEKTADTISKSFTSKPENSSSTCIEQTIEQEKEQLDKRLGGNVYTMEEFSVLRDYAKAHNANTVVGYVSFLHYNNSTKSILEKHRKKAFINKRAQQNIIETKQHIEELQGLRDTAVKPFENTAWKELGEKLTQKKVLQL